MDRQAKRSEQEVATKVAEIKANMPETYKAIQDKAKVQGNEAYAQVRRGLRGEPNCFFAIERGWKMGTPFNITDIQADVALRMVQFGVDYAMVWMEPVAPAVGAAA